MTNHSLGRLQVLASSASFAFSSVAMHWAYAQGFNPYNLHLGISGIAAIVLLLSPRARGWTRRLQDPAVWLYGLAGAGSGLLFGLALVYLQPGLATLLFYTYPVAVTLGAWAMFGRRPAARNWQALALTVSGAALTAGPLGGGVSRTGVLIVLASMLGFALYVLLGERVLEQWNATGATAAMRVMQAGLVLAVAPVAATRIPTGPPLVWIPVLLLLTVTVLAGFLLLTEGIGRVKAAMAALLTAAELPFTMALSWLLLGERFTAWQAVGAALIIAGIIWAEGRPRPVAN